MNDQHTPNAAPAPAPGPQVWQPAATPEPAAAPFNARNAVGRAAVPPEPGQPMARPPMPVQPAPAQPVPMPPVQAHQRPQQQQPAPYPPQSYAQAQAHAGQPPLAQPITPAFAAPHAHTYAQPPAQSQSPFAPPAPQHSPVHAHAPAQPQPAYATGHYASPVPAAVPAAPTPPPSAKTSLLAKLRPAPKGANAPAADAGNGPGFLQGLLVGALATLVVTFAGGRLLGGEEASQPAAVAPEPFAAAAGDTATADGAAPDQTTFLDQALAEPGQP